MVNFLTMIQWELGWFHQLRMSAYTLFLVPTAVSLVSANLKSYKWYKEDVDEIGMNKNLKNAEIN